MNEEIMVSIHSDNETPHLGSGWRIVTARDTTTGRVLLKSGGHVQSVTIDTYNKIVREEYEK